MKQILILGTEAADLGRIDTRIFNIYAYSGTPWTEITRLGIKSTEAIERKIRFDWSVNEETAYAATLCMAYAGKRARVCMKHVGSNLAADIFANSAITCDNSGLIIVADHPSMHSS